VTGSADRHRRHATQHAAVSVAPTSLPYAGPSPGYVLCRRLRSPPPGRLQSGIWPLLGKLRFARLIGVAAPLPGLRLAPPTAAVRAGQGLPPTVVRDEGAGIAPAVGIQFKLDAEQIEICPDQRLRLEQPIRP
jgi:hypothetical protein